MPPWVRKLVSGWPPKLPLLIVTLRVWPSATSILPVTLLPALNVPIESAVRLPEA